MVYKKSIYNLILQEEGEKVIVWNTKSGAIIKLDRDVWNSIQAEDFSNKRFLEFEQGLFDQGLVVEKNFDEYNSMILSKKATQLKCTDSFSLIIAPTLGCNYKCNYCFEKTTDKMYIMSDKTIDSIVEFVNKKIQSQNSLKFIDVTWFGGEPLLGFERVIAPLSTKLIDTCQHYNIEYKSSIITNGYFLTHDLIKDLIEKYAVNSFQITFDGLCETYSKIKNTTNAAYKRVKNNMFALSEYVRTCGKNIKIDIRINIDKNNSNEAVLFFEEIRNSGKNIDNLCFYLGRLQGEEKRYLSLTEFENEENNFELFTNEHLHDMWKPKNVWCVQHTMNSFCIGPNGEMYKCEREIGDPSKQIGNVVTNMYYNKHMLEFLNLESPEQCKQCKLFPVCLGGCPFMAMQSPDRYDCISSMDYAMKLAKRHVGIV